MKINLIHCLSTAAILTLSACTPSVSHHDTDKQTVAQKETAPLVESTPLDAALDAQADEAKARYQFRHPKETLEFFDIQPGMSVGEVLPGGGWYSKILLPLLGEEGNFVGIDYSYDMWSIFRPEEFLAQRKNWAETWAKDAQPWRGDNGAAVSAATLSTIPENLNGTMDAILFVRALHNLARFEDKGGFMSKAVANAFVALKPGGIVGVVQHAAREDRDDEWANGSNGYLKKSSVISLFEAAGFELAGESDINANDKDQADVGDIVWRLPPSFATSGDSEELKQKMLEIGESNRMTLKFRKPITS